jgi:predicted nucleic acid-binding protein
MPTPVIHLDTGFLIRSLLAGSDPDRALRRWLGEGRRVAINSIAWTEFLCGPLGAADVETATMIVTERIPYDEQDGQLAAEFFNGTGRRRGSLIDCMIAASTARRGAMLATLNPADFRRFEPLGLRLVA